MDAAGNFVIAWEGDSASDSSGVVAQLFNADGTAKAGGAFQVNANTADAQINAAVAMNDAGKFVVAYTDQTGTQDHIDAVLYDAAGTIVNTIVAGTTNKDLGNPDVGMNAAGGFAVAWEHQQSTFDFDIRHRLFDASGTAIDTDGVDDSVANNVQVNTYDNGFAQRQPTLAMNAAGDYVIVWHADGFGGDPGQAVFGREYGLDGTPKDTADFRINTSTAGDQQNPAVGIAGNGNFVAVWDGNGTEAGQTDSEGIFAQRYSASAITNTVPTVTLSNQITSLAENTSTVVRVKVADITVTDDGVGTNTLALTGTDAALFEIDGTELFLKAGTALDFETNATLDVNVTVDDTTIGSTPDDTAALAVSVTDTAEVIGPLLLGTAGDVSGGGVPGNDNWQKGDVMQVSDPSLDLGGSTDGTFSTAFDIDVFTTGANVNAVHHVTNDITVGTSAFQLKTGDLLLSVDAAQTLTSSSTPTSPFSNSLAVTASDVFVFRPDATGDYSAGTFALLLNDPSGGNDVRAISLVERDTTIGTSDAVVVKKGDFLLAHAGEGGDDIWLFDTTNVGAGTTLGTLSKLIDGSDANISIDHQVSGLDLIETGTSVGGKNVSAGNILVSVDGDGNIGSNDRNVKQNDVMVLDVVKTTLGGGAGNGDASASRFFDGSDVALNTAAEAIDSFSLVIPVDITNSAPEVSLSNTVAALTEDTDTATRIKVADININDDGIGTNTLALTGSDAALFEIDGTALFLKAGTALDFETNATLDVNVTADDTTIGSGADSTVALAVGITDINEAPTAVTLQNALTNILETASTASRTKVADIVVTDDALGTETFTLSGVDAASFEIDGTELFLKAGVALDFETNPGFNVTVLVDDPTVGANPDVSAALAIAVTDVNEAPTNLTLSNTVTSLQESASTATCTKVADIAFADDALGSENLSLSGADAALFEIDGTELFLKAGAALNFETNPALDVTVSVDDPTVGSNPDATAALTITLTDVNEAPAVALSNVVSNLSESTSTASRVKVADIVVTDDALGSETLTLSGADATLFEIDGTELFIKAGSALDFETNPTLDVTVEVDDPTVGSNPDSTALLAVNILDANEVPTLSLSNTTSTLSESTSTASRVKVADIAVVDDALGTETFSLTGTDASLFEIDGTALFIKAGTVLDFESNATLDVTVNVDDPTVGGNPDATAALSITLIDENEAPTVTLENTLTVISEAASTTARIKVADISVADDALGTETLSLSGADAALFEIDGAELFLKAGTSLDFESNPALDVTVAVDDATVGGNPDATADLSISLSDVNEAPVVTLENQLSNIQESASTATRTKVADITIADDALGSETLTLTGADAALFEIDGAELFLKTGVALDFESNPSLDVTVAVDDPTVGGNPDSTAQLSIAVGDVNEAPVVTLSNTVTTLAESTSTATRIKVADIVVTDDALGTETVALTGDDASLFEIDGTELFLKAGTALNAGTNPVLDVTVAVDDATIGGSPDSSTALSIGITDVNSAPTVALQNTTVQINEAASTAARTKVADIVVTDDGTGTNVLTLSGTEASLFEIDGTELFLKAGVSLDFETQPNLNVIVNVDDATIGTGIESQTALSIALIDENEAPALSLANTVTNISESASLATRLKVADINIDDDALGSETLALSGADASLFEIDGAELFLKAGTSLDFETNASLDVTVAVDDPTVGGNPDATAALSVAVSDVNEAPTMSLANTTTSIAESTSTATRIKVADIAIVDDALGTETLTLSGADAALFEIDGAELFLKAGTSLDFETNPTLDVTVAVDDPTVGGNPDAIAALAIAVGDVNEVPTVTLMNTVTSLAETTSTAVRVKVADVVIADDALGTETLSLSGADASLFEVDGTELFLKAGTTLDFETRSQLDVTVEVDDATVGGTPDATSALTVNITDVNEAPGVSLANTVTSLSESTSTSSRVKVADINVTDDALGSETLTLSGADAALFEIVGTELFLQAGTSLDFETNASLDVTVSVDDATVGGSPDASAVLSIALSDVNEAPTATLQNTVANINESASTATRLKVADIAVTDDALGVETLTLTGADAGLFEIDGAELFLKAGTTLDFETNPSLAVTVAVDDPTLGANPDATAAMTITLLDSNDAPSLTLSGVKNTVTEGSADAQRLKIADVQINDDALGTEALSLGGADAAIFELIGQELFLRAGTSLDAVADPTLTVTVLVDDATVGTNPDDSQAVNISVVPRAAEATVTPETIEITEEEIESATAESKNDEVLNKIDEPEFATAFAEEEADEAAAESAPEEVSEDNELALEEANAAAIEDELALQAIDGSDNNLATTSDGQQKSTGSERPVRTIGGFSPGELLRTAAFELLQTIPQTGTTALTTLLPDGQTVAERQLLETLAAFTDGLDTVRDGYENDVAFAKAVLGSSVVASAGLSVGYVVWLIRGGVLPQ